MQQRTHIAAPAHDADAARAAARHEPGADHDSFETARMSLARWPGGIGEEPLFTDLA